MKMKTIIYKILPPPRKEGGKSTKADRNSYRHPHAVGDFLETKLSCIPFYNVQYSLVYTRRRDGEGRWVRPVYCVDLLLRAGGREGEDGELLQLRPGRHPPRLHQVLGGFALRPSFRRPADETAIAGTLMVILVHKVHLFIVSF
jgi:hypothetical protein